MVVMQKISRRPWTDSGENHADASGLMTFLFINFPAGLVLYWLTNNVLTIVQQFV